MEEEDEGRMRRGVGVEGRLPWGNLTNYQVIIKLGENLKPVGLATSSPQVSGIPAPPECLLTPLYNR